MKMMFTEEITEALKTYLEMPEATVIDTEEFEQFTDSVMIVVSVDTVTQVNPGLQDYEYQCNVALNSFISDDENGQVFKKVRKQITNRLTGINNSVFDSVFANIPVVGYIFESTTKSLGENSNIQTSTFKIYTSTN